MCERCHEAFPQWSRRRLFQGAGALLAARVLPFAEAHAETHDAPANSPGVSPPPWFSQSEAIDAIKAEYESVDEFFDAYSDEMTAASASDAYGLALAYQVIGLLRNAPPPSGALEAFLPSTVTRPKITKNKHSRNLGRSTADIC